MTASQRWRTFRLPRTESKTKTVARSEYDIRDDVLNRLRGCSELGPDEIWVRPQNGAIILTGFVASYKNRRQA
ncbi:MAG: BON domain-containing protein, partial [Cyanobacteria bacterium]|nr:BON domain-containing protein [Cyanobacteriota bacterium]